MVSSKVTTGSAILIAYTLYAFSIGPAKSETPSLRGGAPSLYIEPTALPARGLRGAGSAVEPPLKVDHDDAPFEAYAVLEIMAVLIAMVTVVQCVPTCRSPTRTTTIGSAILIAYTMFSFCMQSSMDVTPSLRGGTPSLYTQRALGATRGLRGVAIEVPGIEMPNVDQDETSFGPCTLFEVIALLVALMALVQRIPSSRTPTRVTTTVSAILIAYALFSFGVPAAMNWTPRLRGGIPAIYMQPALRATGGGLRGNADEVYETHESFADLADNLVQTSSPMLYWVVLAVPAMAMTCLTQQKKHAKAL